MELEPPRAESSCVIVTAEGSEHVHLAVVDGGAPPELTFCQRRILPGSPTRHFQEAGCRACAEVSIAQGFHCAQEAAHVTVNVRRFHDRASRQAELPTQRAGEDVAPAPAPAPASASGRRAR